MTSRHVVDADEAYCSYLSIAAILTLAQSGAWQFIPDIRFPEREYRICTGLRRARHYIHWSRNRRD